jgi:polysaccharide export outer membrane protein
MRTFIVVFVSLIFFVSCKTQNIFMKQGSLTKIPSDTTFIYQANYQYNIRKDDKISVSVWSQDELSVGSVYGIYNSNEIYGKWLLVDTDGNIELPKIGTFNVLNKQIPQLKDTLKRIYKKWILNPVIDVKVLNKEISLLGEFKNPGVLKVDKDQNTLFEMIGRAGGLDFYANIKSIKILRQVGNKVSMTNIDLSKTDNYKYKNISLYPGDIVIVPSKKNKEFDKRISTIVPLLSAISTAAIVSGLFLK